MDKRDVYCPYGIVRDPAAFGARAIEHDSYFGMQHAVLGDRDGPLTIFVHGMGGTWSSWTPLLQTAAAEGVTLDRFLLVDLPGFGKSENLRGALELSAIADMLLAVTESITSEPVALVGQSIGGFFVLAMAAMHPDKVRSVTSLAGSFQQLMTYARHPSLLLRQHPVTVAGTAVSAALSRLGSPGARARRFLRRMGMPDLFAQVTAHPEQLDPSVTAALSSGFSFPNFARTLAAGRSYADNDFWPRIQCPVDLLWGEHDSLVPPSEAALMRELLPSAGATVVADAAHIMHIERPYAVLDRMGRG